MASCVCEVPGDYPAEIIGYADPWIVNPGDEVAIKVSSSVPRLRHRTVRLIQGLDIPHSPDLQSEETTGIQAGTCQGRFQKAQPGSYASIPDIKLKPKDAGFHIELCLKPTLLAIDKEQTILSILDQELVCGLALAIEGGRLVMRCGDGSQLQSHPIDRHPLLQNQWVKLIISTSSSAVDVIVEPLPHLGQKRGAQTRQSITLQYPIRLPAIAHVTLAASRPSNSSKACNFFNGRLQDVSIAAVDEEGHRRQLTRLDFSLKISTNVVVDVSGQGRHGTLTNSPTRGVRGHDWDGSETDWTKARYGYGAIHFHDDDLDDARWDPDFSIRVPDDARSGAYAVDIEDEEDPTVRDSIVFFVRSDLNRPSTVKIAVVLSTFTYLAYGNDRMYDTSKSSQLALIGQQPVPNAPSWGTTNTRALTRLQRRTDIGLSLYDVHTDGSGNVYSSSKRPLLNVRPDFQHWCFGRPREFSADLLTIGFLEHAGLPYDVLTDHQLHHDGAAALARYSTVVTGSHPEYPTLRSLDAYAGHVARGGNALYLGGNGFYWLSVLAETPDRSHLLEVRRGDQGVRTYGLPGGERHHSLDPHGVQGGLWRSRGRGANYLWGVGCCGEGVGPGVPYSRAQAQRHQPGEEAAAARRRFDWVFEGLGADELIGECGFGGGASGDEIDRWDPAHGSAVDAVVLASSVGHPDTFALFPEDIGFMELDVLGPQTSKVRSDMVMCETSAGGHVFSVGSMNWNCSLGWDGYDNNVAKITENVLRRFSEQEKT